MAHVPRAPKIMLTAIAKDITHQSDSPVHPILHELPPP